MAKSNSAFSIAAFNKNVVQELKDTSKVETKTIYSEGFKKLKDKKDSVRTLNPESVINQIIEAYKGGKLVASIGLMMGGFVPLALFAIVHGHIDPNKPLWLQINAYIAAGALVRSAFTVYEWYVTFLSKEKAIATVVLIEGVMTFSGILWLSIAALIMLIAINAISTACSLHRHRFLFKKTE